MANIYSVAIQAIDAYKRLNDAAKYVLPEDIEKIVKKHAAIAVATAFIPVGGLDMVAATANVWTMYVRINNALGIKFSDNKMKSIGSAVVSNLVQNLGIAAVAVALISKSRSFHLFYFYRKRRTMLNSCDLTFYLVQELLSLFQGTLRPVFIFQIFKTGKIFSYPLRYFGITQYFQFLCALPLEGF